MVVRLGFLPLIPGRAALGQPARVTLSGQTHLPTAVDGDGFCCHCRFLQQQLPGVAKWRWIEQVVLTLALWEPLASLLLLLLFIRGVIDFSLVSSIRRNTSPIWILAASAPAPVIPLSEHVTPEQM